MSYPNQGLTLKEFSDANVRRCEGDYGHMLHAWSLNDWGVAAAGELGEALNLLKKLRRGTEFPNGAYKGIEHDIALELADAVTYIDLLCSRLGYDMTTVLIEKFNIISDRIGSKIKLYDET